MKKKILATTIVSLALAPALLPTQEASALVMRDGDYVQWYKVDEDGRQLYGSAWELTLSDSEGNTSKYYVEDNIVNASKNYDSDAEFLPDAEQENGTFGVFVPEGIRCAEANTCDNVTVELKEVKPPQGYDLPENNEPAKFTVSRYKPEWGSDDLSWATMNEEGLFTLSPTEDTEPGTYTFSLDVTYSPEDFVKGFRQREDGVIIADIVSGSGRVLGKVDGGGETPESKIEKVALNEYGDVVAYAVDGQEFNLGFPALGTSLQVEVLPSGFEATEDNQIVQGETKTMTYNSMSEIDPEGATFSVYKVSTDILLRDVNSPVLEVLPAKNHLGWFRLQQAPDGSVKIAGNEDVEHIYSSQMLGMIVNTKTPPTTVEKTVVQTTTAEPSTTTVTAPPGTVTSTTTTTKTPGVVTTTQMVTPEASTETVTKTPEKETVTKTPEKETVTKTPEKETVTETPDASVVTTTFTPAPVTTVKTETVTAETTVPVETTVTETSVAEIPMKKLIYVTEQPQEDDFAQELEQRDSSLAKPMRKLANTGADSTLSIALLAGQTALVGALIGFNNRRKNKKDK